MKPTASPPNHTPATSALAERLEGIAGSFAREMRGVQMRERDYTYWLFVDLANEFGRERLLGGLGVLTTTIRRVLSAQPDLEPLLTELVGAVVIASALTDGWVDRPWQIPPRRRGSGARIRPA